MSVLSWTLLPSISKQMPVKEDLEVETQNPLKSMLVNHLYILGFMFKWVQLCKPCNLQVFGLFSWFYDSQPAGGGQCKVKPIQWWSWHLWLVSPMRPNGSWWISPALPLCTCGPDISGESTSPHDLWPSPSTSVWGIRAGEALWCQTESFIFSPPPMCHVTPFARWNLWWCCVNLRM